MLSGSKVALLAVASLLALPLACELVHDFASARFMARKAACTSNLWELGQALVLYADAHDGRLPSADRWVDALTPYVRDPEAFRCPEAPTWGYAMDSRLSGAKVERLAASTIVLFDTDDLRRNATHAGAVAGPRHPFSVFAFADGHAKGIVGERDLTATIQRSEAAIKEAAAYLGGRSIHVDEFVEVQ